MNKRSPKNLNKVGKKFWKSVLLEYEFEKSHDFELLAQAAECLDRIAQCQEAILSDGLFQNDRYGRKVEHDGCKIERAQKKLFLSIVRELGLTLDRAEAQQKKRLY
jgi:P27 family predicted phage terminase small subunit